jgi:acetoin utilization deacetylase AcuC-like enzyme
MLAYYCDHFVLPLPEGHRFPMTKYCRLRERLLADGILQRAELREPDAVSWEDLHLVHEPAYVDAVARGLLDAAIQRRIGFPWSPQMVERSRRSVGGTIAAARAATRDGIAANLAGGTHHAFADRGEGYCVFNDVAVAARVMQRDGAATRPLVVDCDVHQGNGTAAIFRNDPTVFTFSIHGEKNFPFAKERSDLDVMLPDGTDDAAYLARLEPALDLAIDRHRPDFVFYISGADPYEGDRLGRLSLTIEGLASRDALVFERCHRAGLPVAVSMGGGYAHDIDAIVEIHSNTIREAARCAATTAPAGIRTGRVRCPPAYHEER